MTLSLISIKQASYFGVAHIWQCHILRKAPQGT